MPILPFDTLQKLDLPLTEMVGGRIGFAHDLFLSFPYETVEQLPADDRDLVVLTGKGERSEAIAELAGRQGRVVVVMAPGDAPVRDVYVPGPRGLPSNFVALFATSNELADRRAISVPLGVRVNKLRPLRFVRQNHFGRRNGLLYGNFTVNDSHYRPGKDGTRHVRERLVEHFAHESWVHLDISAQQRDSPEELIRYYANLASHRFVLSPEGNGVDCYRTWEALYLGAIPIVMSSPATSAFADLPILFTEDYSELSEDYLEQRWLELSRSGFEIERLLASRYRERFLSAVARLNEPRFVCWKFDSPKFHEVLARSSRSAAGIEAETPAPPFVACDDLMTPKGWNTPGGLSLERADGKLLIRAIGRERQVIEIPLLTMAGASFELTGTVQAESDSPTMLLVDIEERPDVIAKAEVGGGQDGEALELRFVGRSERTVLSIRAQDASVGTAWLIANLCVKAIV